MKELVRINDGFTFQPKFQKGDGGKVTVEGVADSLGRL